ncbi:MAG: beta-agarase [Verrucomicrobiota bacterium]
MKFTLPSLSLLALVVLTVAGNEPEVRNITLAEIDGRHWLVDADGKPFFAHGITHVGVKRAKIDFEEISEACKELGFNAYGYGCPDQLRGDMPYVESWNHLVPSSYYRGKENVKFVDIFDPAEQAKLEAGVKANCFRSRQHPHHVIGFCWTDLGSWPLDNPSGTNWVEFIRGLPEDAPGNAAYGEFLETWKGDDEKARDAAFLRLIAREYFRVVGEAQRKYAPDHLVFGDRFGFNTLSPQVLEEMLPYVDGIAIQPPFTAGFPKAQLDDIHARTGKPILLCDYAVRFKDGDKDIRSWKPAADSVAAGKDYAEYVKAALETDYIVGVFFCNPVDTPKGFGNPGVKQGFFGEGLAERPGLHQSVKELNAYRDEITPRGNVAHP